MRFLFIFCILLLTRAVHANEETPACAAAVAKPNYGKLKSVPDEIKNLVESYRAGWRSFCGDSPSRPTLADLYAQGKKIEAAYFSNLEKRSSDETLDTEKEFVQEHYPSFVPAFFISFEEHPFFRPSKSEFESESYRGREEDQLFFASSVGKDWFLLYPWFDQDQTYAGCVQFGTFDWRSEIKNLVLLRKKMKSEVYLDAVRDYEEKMLAAPGPGLATLANGHICTCQEKAAVLKDLKTIAQTISEEPSLNRYLASAQDAVKAVSSGKVGVKSNAEAFCVE